jgi:hypothetical protein
MFLILHNVGVFDQFWSPVVLCYAIKDAVRIVNSFITIQITRNYDHNYFLRCYAFAQLQSYTFVTKQLIPLLYVYTVYKHYTLIFTALLDIKSPNWLNTSSLAGFSAINCYLKLSHTVAHAMSSIPTASRLRYLLRKTLAEILLSEFTS